MKRGFLQNINVVKKEKEKENEKEKEQSVIKKVKREEEDDLDGLSTLTTELIHNIFSFLDTKQVVQTSVLSRKWRDFWISVPTLNIDDQFWVDDNLRTTKVMNFVNKVLLLRDGSNIQKFCLKCPIDDSNRISDWVTSVVRRNVQDLHLQGVFVPSPSIFRLSTTLTTLVLSEVTLTSQMSVNWCGPALENLIMENCFHDDIHNLLISSPQLKYLKVKSENRCQISGPTYSRIKICAPKLEVLECIGYLYQDYCLENLSSLVTAHVDTEHVSRDNIIEVLDKCLANILRGLTHVQSLTLSLSDFQGSAELPSMLRIHPNSFPNLKYLKLTDWRTDRYMHGVARLFEIFSCIETLIVQKAEASRQFRCRRALKVRHDNLEWEPPLGVR